MSKPYSNKIKRAKKLRAKRQTTKLRRKANAQNEATLANMLKEAS